MYILLRPVSQAEGWPWKVPGQGTYGAVRRPFGRQIQTKHNHSPPRRINQLYSSLSGTIKHRMEGDFRAGR
jgi:hypothetical protein